MSQMPLAPPITLLPWLEWEQSLTNKLHVLAGDARLDVQGQCWLASDTWDETALALYDTPVMHREIVMWAFDAPCWYARTIMPKITYDSNRVLFDRLRTESLGALIFGDTPMTRRSLTHYPISPQSVEYAWLRPMWHQDAPVLWVRLSEFTTNGGGSFFLVEILLPGLMRYLS